MKIISLKNPAKCKHFQNRKSRSRATAKLFNAFHSIFCEITLHPDTVGEKLTVKQKKSERAEEETGEKVVSSAKCFFIARKTSGEVFN